MRKCRCHLRGINSVFSSERPVCTLHILEKELSLLWPRKGFVIFLFNVDDSCYKTAADRTEKQFHGQSEMTLSKKPQKGRFKLSRCQKNMIVVEIRGGK